MNHKYTDKKTQLILWLTKPWVIIYFATLVLVFTHFKPHMAYLNYISIILAGAALASTIQRYILEHFEDKLEESEKENLTLIDRYHVLTENLASSVIIRDPDGQVLYCSPFTSNLTGYSLDDIYEHQGDFFKSIIHPDDLETYQHERKYCQIGERYQGRYRIYNQQDFEVWVDARSVPIFNNQGQVISSLTIAFDVTGAVRKEQQIEEKNRDLADFTYMVSHDLKSPIHTIRGMLNIINEDHAEELTEGVSEVLHHISGSAERLEALVASVLEYAKISGEEMKVVPIELEEVLASVSKDFEHLIQQADAKLSIDQNLPKVMGNTTQLYQIISNLVSNAIKYRDKNRELEVQIKLLKANNDREICLAVIDNGQGVPEHQLEKIFRPFQRAHGKEIEGSGIGLACVNKLVEKIGGSIRLESEEGKGSSFIVSLKKAS